MTLFSGLGLGLIISLGFAFVAAFFSGRRSPRSNWARFFLGISLPSALLIGFAAREGAWFELHRKNVAAWAIMGAGAITTVSHQVDRDVYGVVVRSSNPHPGILVYNGLTVKHFDFPISTALGIGLIAGIPIACVALGARHLFGRRRYPPGHCPKCGYNLTGAPHERCPECGEAVQVRRLG